MLIIVVRCSLHFRIFKIIFVSQLIDMSGSKKIFALILLQSLGFIFAKAQTYTFTNAGATGNLGPTQSDIDNNYSGTNLQNAVTVTTRGIQEWDVPSSGTYSD